MFRKDKKPESTLTATADADPLRNSSSNLNTWEQLQSRDTLHRGFVTDLKSVHMHDSDASTFAFATSHAEGRAAILDHIRMLKEVHAVVCTCLNPAESITELTNALDSMECPTDDCKSCKYFRPGGVDFCNTSLRIAEFLVLNGMVNVFRVPGLDKPE